jgi:hypothetical protein
MIVPSADGNFAASYDFKHKFVNVGQRIKELMREFASWKNC